MSSGFRTQRRSDEFEANPFRFAAGAAPATSLPQTAWQMALDYAKSLYSGVTAPGDAYRGTLDPTSDEGVKRAMDMAGGVTLGAGAIPGEIGALRAGITPPRSNSGALAPQFAERYPKAGGWEWRTDPKKPEKGPYQGKVRTAEEEKLMEARAQAEKDMEGGYVPYFDPAKRTMVDPKNYPTTVDTTTQVLPAKQVTRDKYEALANQPEGITRLRNAFQEGLGHTDIQSWYAMKQLEDVFVKELGPEAGRKAFQEKFANAMAATTAGASPKENFLMAMYGNYARERGMKAPGMGKSYEIPSPMGGQYAGGNLATHLDPERKFEPFGIENPKRHDFEYSFLGHDKAVVDKQMMQLFDPKLAEGGTAYGSYSKVLGQLAEDYGVSPQEFQAIAWMGSKAMKDPGYVPHPMIQTVNDAIERTRRVTGMDPDEIVRRGIVRSEIPIYSRAIPGMPIQPREQQGPPMPTWLPAQQRKRLTGTEEEFI